MLMPLGVATLGEFPQMGRAYFHEGKLVRLEVNRVFHDLLRPFAFAVIISFEFSVH